ncbi:MAG: DnaA N-terminal domain-containing protein, partial [Flavobacteriales bacterium]
MKKDHEKIWDRCLEVIKDNVSQQSFTTWFQPIRAVKLVDEVLTIQVPSQFFYEWLEEHYIGLLKKIIKKEVGNEG